MKAVVYGMAALGIVMLVWYVMSPTVETLASTVDNLYGENELGTTLGTQAYSMWPIVLIAFIGIILLWMFLYSQREVRGTEPI